MALPSVLKNISLVFFLILFKRNKSVHWNLSTDKKELLKYSVRSILPPSPFRHQLDYERYFSITILWVHTHFECVRGCISPSLSPLCMRARQQTHIPERTRVTFPSAYLHNDDQLYSTPNAPKLTPIPLRLTYFKTLHSHGSCIKMYTVLSQSAVLRSLISYLVPYNILVKIFVTL